MANYFQIFDKFEIKDCKQPKKDLNQNKIF